MDRGFQGFSLEGDAPKGLETGTPIDHAAVPYISSPEAWAQYHDENCYLCDKTLREWIAEMEKSKPWCRNARKRRYTFGMLFELLFGVKYEGAKHARYINTFSRIFAYYSSRVQKGGSINGKTYSKTVYTISPGRLKKPAYSLKLRFEMLAENGRDVDGRSMKMPKDDLPPGHARNPRTDRLMETKREEGRRRFNEYRKDRRDRLEGEA